MIGDGKVGNEHSEVEKESSVKQSQINIWDSECSLEDAKGV